MILHAGNRRQEFWALKKTYLWANPLQYQYQFDIGYDANIFG